MKLKKSEIEKWCEAIAKAKGNITRASMMMKVSMKTGYNYLKDNVELQIAKKEVQEEILDNAESMLYKKIFEEEDTTALIFFLKTQGKSRGYGQTISDNLSEFPKIVIEIVDSNNNKIDMEGNYVSGNKNKSH